MGFERQDRAAKRAALRLRAIEYKGGQCAICKYKGCAAAFDFHHVDSLTKDFAISDRMTSFKAIQGELDKCVLLCARCHREVHDGLHPGFLTLEGSERGPDEDEDPYGGDEEESH